MYSDIILALYANPAHYGPLAKKTATSSSNNPSCGDDIAFDIQIENDEVVDVGFYGESCAISRAAASLLAEHIIGRRIEEIREMNRETMYALIGSKIHPGRVQCLLLPLQIVHKLIAVV